VDALTAEFIHAIEKHVTPVFNIRTGLAETAFVVENMVSASKTAYIATNMISYLQDFGTPPVRLF
jgi:hypothetical protein